MQFGDPILPPETLTNPEETYKQITEKLRGSVTGMWEQMREKPANAEAAVAEAGRVAHAPGRARARRAVPTSFRSPSWFSVQMSHSTSRALSTRIAEVENPGQPDGPEKPVGNDSGYLWRLYSYWRFYEHDGGVYIQLEAISLTRGIPAGLGWLIRPFITSIPQESLTFTLTHTRDALQKP